MSFPRYPAYKDSGVEWLGKVPEHWHAVRFSRLIAAIKDGTHGTFARVSDGLPLLSAKNVLDGFLEIGESESLISESDHEEITSNGFPRKGDLLLTIVGTLGRCCVFERDEPISFQRSVCFIRLRDGHFPRFFYFVTQSQFFQEQLIGRSKSAAQAGVYMGDVAAMTVLLPPCDEEQQSIAAFLDRETAKIDALVAEQEQLITLLKEKRQAVISHAVTKGLDPSVPMKDSGVEWVGEVPAHWQVRRIKDVTRLESGHTPSKTVPEYWVDCDIPWVSLNDSKYLAANDYITDTAVQINQLGIENSSARLLPAGAVVFTRDATIGLAAITTREMAVSQHLIAWCPNGLMDPLYLLRVFNAMKDHLDSYTFGATIKTIGMGDVKSLMSPVPPLHEQVAIAAFLGKELQALDQLVDEAVLSIELLRERRSALISAAVTGQIDVRRAV